MHALLVMTGLRTQALARVTRHPRRRPFSPRTTQTRPSTTVPEGCSKLSLRFHLSVGAPPANHTVGGIVAHRAIVATDRRGALAAAAATAAGAHLACIKVSIVKCAALAGVVFVPLTGITARVTAAPFGRASAIAASEGRAALPAVCTPGR